MFTAKTQTQKGEQDMDKNVLVTTVHRGVFFGNLLERNGESVVLARCRNCVYWDSSLKGFLGLATSGPTGKCKIGPACDRSELFGVTSINDVSDEAARKWEDAPWS